MTSISELTTDKAFKILKLTLDASLDDVNRQYRHLVLKHDPDKNQGEEVGDRISFVELGAAYELLKTYLEQLATESGPSGSSRPTNRSDADAGSLSSGQERARWGKSSEANRKEAYAPPLLRLSRAALTGDEAMASAAEEFHSVIRLALAAEGRREEATSWSACAYVEGTSPSLKPMDALADTTTAGVPTSSLSDALKFVLHAMHETYVANDKLIVDKLNATPGELDDTDIFPFLDARVALATKWRGIHSLLWGLRKDAERLGQSWSEESRRSQLELIAQGFARLETEEARRVLWALTKLDGLDP